jgi:hypothetical protein
MVRRSSNNGFAEERPLAAENGMFAEMLQRLERDPLWAREYEDFVRQVSFAAPGRTIGFTEALDARARLVMAAQGTREGK